MATITATQAISGIQPKGNHRGVDAVQSSLNLGGAGDPVSLSAGDVILWGRVPHGSTLIAIIPSGAVVGLDVQETFVLDGSTLGSVNAASRAGFLADVRIPHTVSLSGDALGIDGQNAMLKSIIGSITSGSGVGVMSTTFLVTRDPGGEPKT